MTHNISFVSCLHCYEQFNFFFCRCRKHSKTYNNHKNFKSRNERGGDEKERERIMNSLNMKFSNQSFKSQTTAKYEMKCMEKKLFCNHHNEHVFFFSCAEKNHLIQLVIRKKSINSFISHMK